MATTYYGNITGPLWGATPESSYDIIVDNVQEQRTAENTPLMNGGGDVVYGAIHGASGELTMDFAIKGTNHLGLDSLVGSKITTLDNPEFAGPWFVTANSRSRQKGDWATGNLTAVYYETDFDIQTTAAATTA
jgi:hypothetical protein